ncbi:hypothetical protein [Pusillimonas sp. ANT_WB101]|nr:hypothetical protein [Pusillimonas sp. ANT_WB101]
MATTPHHTTPHHAKLSDECAAERVNRIAEQVCGDIVLARRMQAT